MSRASEIALDTLHELVAKTLTDSLHPVEVDVFDKDGKKTGTKVIHPSPQMLSAAIKFLKDNGIDAPKSSARFADLSAALDDLDLDAIGAGAPN